MNVSFYKPTYKKYKQKKGYFFLIAQKKYAKIWLFFFNMNPKKKTNSK